MQIKGSGGAERFLWCIIFARWLWRVCRGVGDVVQVSGECVRHSFTSLWRGGSAAGAFIRFVVRQAFFFFVVHSPSASSFIFILSRCVLITRACFSCFFSSTVCFLSYWEYHFTFFLSLYNLVVSLYMRGDLKASNGCSCSGNIYIKSTQLRVIIIP